MNDELYEAVNEVLKDAQWFERHGYFQGHTSVMVDSEKWQRLVKIAVRLRTEKEDA